ACLGFGEKCNPSNDKCCKSSSLVCSQKHKWCKYGW
uniref:Beta-theraphotoxin-Hlv1a n=1 Tax=Cyriopagopus lividus TaxID=2053133 RepID=HTX1_CYRLI|nr:RecName: Full=Beta-theraphotoxin-Hlv1a; Short=Beta-TRTX-Hlv1a; AltName: Full=Beta-theraphotoxin-Hl1a; Short=Beta-TRTX-Hl1a; AltName: Full=Haplotoxin-1 [Haplopelma lividum]